MKIDIHKLNRRLSNSEAAFQISDLPQIDKDLVHDWINQMFSDGLGVARISKYLSSLKAVYKIRSWSIQEITSNEIMELSTYIERSQWQSWTKHDYKLALRKYLIFCKHEDLADMFKVSKGTTKKLPDELITPDDVRKLLEVCRSTQDKAFMFCLWESGARIGELLSIRKKNVHFDKLGAVLILDGKTGMRRVRLLDAAPILHEWISDMSFKPDEAIFPKNYAAYLKHLTVLSKRANIDKRIYPHLFRHSRATFLAGYLTEAQLCAYMGWTISSSMPRIYVHLNGYDLDAALTRIPEFMNDKK